MVGIWVEKVETVDVICSGLSLTAIRVAYGCKAIVGLQLIVLTDATDRLKCSVVVRCERTGDGVRTSIPRGRLPWGTVGLSVSSLSEATVTTSPPTIHLHRRGESLCARDLRISFHASSNGISLPSNRIVVGWLNRFSPSLSRRGARCR